MIRAALLPLLPLVSLVPPVPLVPLVLPQALGPGQDPEREWRARARALEPMEHLDEVAAGLGSGDWRERHGVLDAFARTPRAARVLVDYLAESGVSPTRLLADPHPNVRAAALAVLFAAGRGPDPGDPRVARGVGDPFESVRRALARGLARAQTPVLAPGSASPGLRLLARLAAAGDGAGELARAALFSAGLEATTQQRALLLRGDVLDGAALLEALPHLRRAPVSAVLVEDLRRALPESGPGRASAAALVEVLALHGELDGALDGVLDGVPDGERAGPVCDRGVLVAGWGATPPLTAPVPGPPVDSESDAERTRAARDRYQGILAETAREGDVELGERLLRAAARDPSEGADFEAECGALALPVERALSAARDLPDDLAEAVWDALAPRVEALDPWLVAPYLAADRGPGLRSAVAGVVAETFLRSGDPGAEELLWPLLHVPDGGRRRSAFRWLCGGPGAGARMEGLHQAWRTYGAEERELCLRFLPRDRPPTPFRDDLLALCQRVDRRTAPVIELLGLLRDDGVVAAALGRWLEEALAGMERARDREPYATHEWRAKALVLALGRVALDPLESALVRGLAARPPPSPLGPGGERHHPELPKTCASLLGKTAAGRARLVRFLGPEVRRRTRVEAAIFVAPDPHLVGARPAALAALLEGDAHSDSELGVRVLAAIGRTPGPEALAHLEGRAREEGHPLERRLAAVDALAARASRAAAGEVGARAALVRVLAEARVSEVWLAAAGVLGSVGGGEAAAALRAEWTRRRARGEDPALVDELLVPLMDAGGLAREDLGLPFQRALAAAPGDLAGRLAGQIQAAPSFRWRVELAAAERLARDGELSAALDAAGPWWRMDGELLLELGTRAREAGEGEAARRLLLAARVALLGEPPTRATRGRGDRAALGLAALAGERRDWDGAAAWAQELLGSLRRGGGPSSSLAEALGRFDRPAGVDPAADLAAAVVQARAWGALERGDPEVARALARRARGLLGASRAARDAQARLETALDR